MTNDNYSYPIDPSWTTKELEIVIKMFNQVEKAYEGGANRQQLLKAYQDFKQVVPAKSEEKQIGRKFYEASGYQLYDAVKAAQQTDHKIITLSRG
ncbi:UPF0223 family protein [uncultured Limosilactobacillus sp.]|uniref:UPF0223 family protein n=1 Tax=uncultured Limosilactobacillus sp. TaxID=2837629 RepID=UPI0025D33FED|nr:UPF0223 family protein [uncultured Limosilactobacillus sp.]